MMPRRHVGDAEAKLSLRPPQGEGGEAARYMLLPVASRDRAEAAKEGLFDQEQQASPSGKIVGPKGPHPWWRDECCFGGFRAMRLVDHDVVVASGQSKKFVTLR